MLPWYKVELVDAKGKTLADIEDAISVQAARAFNSDGNCTVVLPASHDLSFLRMHTRMKLWRHDYEGIARPFTDTLWFLKKIDRDLDEQTVTLSFVDTVAMIDTRLVAYTSQSPYADKTLEEYELVEYDDVLRLDNMMRAYMRENFGSEVLDSTRQVPTLEVELDRHLAPYGEKQAAWAQVGNVLQDLARMSSDKGLALYYDLQVLADGRLQFRVTKGYPGMDRTSQAPKPLVLSQEVGLLSEVHEIVDWTETVSAVYVLGFDAGGSQVIAELVATNLLLNDPFGRIEATVNANDADALSVLEDTGRSFLAGHAERRVVTARIVESSSLSFGRDFDYGDGVVALVGVQQYDCLINAVSVQWQDGEEQLEIRLRGERLADTTAVLVAVTDPGPLPGEVGNQAPVPNAGADQTVDFGVVVDLAGSATDDGKPNPPAALTYAWSKLSGPGTVTFGDDSLAATTATIDAAGVYVLRLTVSDSLLSAVDDMSVTVNAAPPPENSAPVVDAGDDQIIDWGMAAVLAGSASDDGLPNPPAALTYLWTQVSGPDTAFISPDDTLEAVATFAAPGIYVLRLTADDSELSSSDDIIITVSEL